MWTLHSQTRPQWQWIETTRRQKMSKSIHSSLIRGETGWLAHQIAAKDTRPEKEWETNYDQREKRQEIWQITRWLVSFIYSQIVCTIRRWSWCVYVCMRLCVCLCDHFELEWNSHWIHKKASSAYRSTQLRSLSKNADIRALRSNVIRLAMSMRTLYTVFTQRGHTFYEASY